VTGRTIDADDSNLPLTLTINRAGDGGLTGLAPTVRLRLGHTADTYLDWADNTFKTVGWTTLNAAMSEVGDGHYLQTLDMSAVTVATGRTLVAEYSVDDGGEVKAVAADTLHLTDTNERLLDVWRILGLDPSHPLEVKAVSREAGTEIGQTIQIIGGTTVKVTRVF
jgi:hypothetical protein